MKLTTRNPAARGSLARRLVAGATLATFVATPSSALAALTDIANAPISSAATTVIPPNVMFILDASGSMNSEYMPDSASSYNGDAGGKSHLCNSIYYNPAISYPLPKNSDGTDFGPANFVSARRDGFPSNSPSGTVNLGSDFQPNSSSSSEPAYYYKWTPNTAGNLPDDNDCNADDSNNFPHTQTTARGKWDKVRIAAAEQQNFANWYSFYRTRLMLMKTGAGLAFAGLNDNFRVGFITICPNGSSCNDDNALVPVTSNYYLKIDNFTPSHKAAWYSKFYNMTGNSFTPLRQALARVGRHYAGKTDGINSGMPDDPIQFSCQQNFSLLTTDGYWNYGKGKQLNGTTDIGAQDQNLGLTPRPMFDGGAVTTNTVTQNEQQYYDRWRNNSSDCSGQGSGYTRWYRRTQTITTTVDQSGNTSTSTSSSSTNQTNGCFQSPPLPGPLPTSWTTFNTTVTGGTTSASGGTANTLSDVAEYYYRTDLRPLGSLNASGVDVSKDNVPQSGTGVEDDKARHQHMTTFTLGLGVSGQLQFQDDYKTASSGDFTQIRAGAMGWPDPNPGSPNGASSAQNLARIDDLWHAAVNGRGTAYSATDPVSLAVALKTALSAIQAKLSSAAAAATSSLEPTVTDRLAFTPTYVTADWTGELQAFRIDLSTGQLEPGEVWSARDKLNARTRPACDNRNIFLYKKGATDNLVSFTQNTFACDGTGAPTGAASNGLDPADMAHFNATRLSGLTQWTLMTEDGAGPQVDQQTLAVGANLVNFLRGQRGMEGFSPNTTQLYRGRKHVLGDIVNATPVFVRQPYFDYTDAGYDAFKNTSPAASRIPMVYVGSNAGMLHGFNGSDDPATGGEEVFAFVPRMVLPNLYRLADTNWANLHEYYVDATVTAGDVDADTSLTPPSGTSDWRTIIVGGLSKGGRGYYALDVTNPNAAKALWEFTLPAGATAGSCVDDAFSDCDLGYTFGNPIISKLATGQWVVFVTSGYNNVSPGSGEGYLYVLDAMTGKKLYKIPTGAGNTTTPSGLTKIRNWVSGNAAQNNTTERVYGVDIVGNVWRFDVNNNFGPAGREATLLATLKDDVGNPQPITTRPELAEAGSPPAPYVYVATGRYLAGADVSDTQVQSLYAIRDPLDPTTFHSNPRATFRRVTMTVSGQERYAECVDPSGQCTSNQGWFTDFPEPGERVNVDMKLQLGAVVVASNVPANTACEPGGVSYISAFNFSNGLAAAGTNKPVGKAFSSALAVGINIIRLPDGKVVVIGMDASGTPQIAGVELEGGQPKGQRITWREIAD